ncbi:MAG TPA: DEAD/DEAH box helicase [Kineosporiaceae bacterium]|nr:DEAD/DEAH box helicase [Kineosporiaceae bacterium]
MTPFAPLIARLAEGRPVDPVVSLLVDGALEVWSRPGFDTLVSLGRVHFEPFEHQMATVRTVLRRMRGRAILADEVGLGKTIEAALVLSELRARGLARRALVVAPAGLVGQWQEELDRKFALPSRVVTGGCAADLGSDGAGLDGTQYPVVLASLAAARREPLRSALVGQDWDVVIIDEAHRVRSPRSASGRLARDLRSRHLLLLTATPVENRLDDLFQLVSLVAPGLLGTAAEFRRAHGNGAGKAAGASAVAPGPALVVRDIERLQARTREVMVRHRRSEVALILPQRLAETVKVHLPEQERRLYAEVAERIRQQGRDATPSRLMGLRSLARLAGSSPAALAPGLARAGWDDLAARAQAIKRSRKEEVLLERVGRHLERKEKVIVFTAFNLTLERLAGGLESAGVEVVRYHGGLSRAAKDAAVHRFEDDVQVLVSTEAAGEGRNLQFCHAMLNMDLPWNPMQIEQRIGRLHRIGQQHDVLLTNIVGVGTIEERILDVLESKINLFELVVGELDMILGRVEEDFDFEAGIFGAYVASDDDREFDLRLAEIGDSLARARGQYVDVRESLDALVGRDEPE